VVEWHGHRSGEGGGVASGSAKMDGRMNILNEKLSLIKRNSINNDHFLSS
jgi:hypothetical protein